MSCDAMLEGLGYVMTQDHGGGASRWEKGTAAARAALVRQVAELAEREAALSASRLANDPAAQEHAAWLRRQRQAAELRLESLDAPPRTDQPSLF